MIDELMKYLGKKIKKLSLEHFLLLFIFIFGFLLRLWMVFTKPIWLDEMSYYSMAASESFGDLLILNHWIKNVPPFYLIFVKLWTLFLHSKVWFRIPGLYSYIFCFLLFLDIFKKSNSIVRLLTLGIYSGSVYFIFIQSWLSPYNFVIFLGLLLTLVIKKYLEGSYYDRQAQFVALLVFIHWLLINTHYSSLYFMPLYLLLLSGRKKSGASLKILLKLLLVLLVVTLPTFIRVILNYKEIVRISSTTVPWVDYRNPLSVFSLVLRSLFRLNNIWMMFGFGLLLFLIFVYKKTTRTDEESMTDGVFSFVFVWVGLIILYLLGMYIPSVVNERAFFIFHIGYCFLVARIMSGSSLSKMTVVLSILLFITMSISLYNGLIGNTVVVLPGDVTFQVLPDDFY